MAIDAGGSAEPAGAGARRQGEASAEQRASAQRSSQVAPAGLARTEGSPARVALVLINRKSRQGHADLRPALDLLHEANLEVVEVSSDDHSRLGQAIDEHRGALDRVVVGGGDGTLNALADALVELSVPVGILPMGTANDLARTLDLPSDLSAAAAVIARGRTRRIDLGCINGKHFFNVASLGLSTEVARELTRETKRRWGVLGYPLALWRAVHKRRSFHAEIRCDQERLRLRSIQIWIGNGRYFGGGVTIAADARIDDGMLDLVSLTPRRFWQLMLSAPRLLWGHHQDQRLRHWRGTEIEVRTRRPMPINTDGEVTTQTPAQVRVVPGAISVYVP
jgi:diacylglycerol kinase (ATP)